MNINSDTLQGIIYPIALWMLGKAFASVSQYFKSKSDTLDEIKEAVIEMKGQMKLYDEKMSEIPRLKKGMGILFRKVGMNEIADINK